MALYAINTAGMGGLTPRGNRQLQQYFEETGQPEPVSLDEERGSIRTVYRIREW
jgi:hypothetical protein